MEDIQSYVWYAYKLSDGTIVVGNEHIMESPYDKDFPTVFNYQINTSTRMSTI